MSDGAKIHAVQFARQPAENLARDLRAMADAVDRGEILDVVAAWSDQGEYQLMSSASLVNSLTLATLLHRRTVDRFLGE